MSPLGEGLTGPLRYVLAPSDYNGTVPSGYNYTSTMQSNTVQPHVVQVSYSSRKYTPAPQIHTRLLPHMQAML